jgi:hypothetical protein
LRKPDHVTSQLPADDVFHLVDRVIDRAVEVHNHAELVCLAPQPLYVRGVDSAVPIWQAAKALAVGCRRPLQLSEVLFIVWVERAAAHSPRLRTTPSFLSFSHVCSEPVLGKTIVFSMKRLKTRSFSYRAVARGFHDVAVIEAVEGARLDEDSLGDAVRIHAHLEVHRRCRLERRGWVGARVGGVGAVATGLGDSARVGPVRDCRVAESFAGPGVGRIDVRVAVDDRVRSACRHRWPGSESVARQQFSGGGGGGLAAAAARSPQPAARSALAVRPAAAAAAAAALAAAAAAAAAATYC